MSPKRRQKRKLKQSEVTSPKSPSEIQPAKIQSKINNMSTDSTEEILKILNKINDQQNEFKQQQNELKSATNANTDALKLIAEQNTLIKDEMTQLLNGIKIEFKAEIDKIQNKIDTSSETFNHKVNEISNSISNLEARVEHVEKDHERFSRMNELKLIGVPFIENENLSITFIKLAELLGYDASNTINIPSISRTIKRNKITNEITHTKIIIMKFIALHMKETFFSLYLQLLSKKKISTRDLGFNAENRIIINENLTRNNQEIFFEANKLKWEKKIAQVFSINGIVNIKILKGGSTHESDTNTN